MDDERADAVEVEIRRGFVDKPLATPLTGVRLAVRKARGQPLATSTSDDEEAYALALAIEREARDETGEPPRTRALRSALHGAWRTIEELREELDLACEQALMVGQMADDVIAERDVRDEALARAWSVSDRHRDRANTAEDELRRLRAALDRFIQRTDDACP
jgi:hypothetical protein